MRGCRFDLFDAKVHGDNAQRGGNQILPMARRALYACELTGKPTL
jgi:elongation factor 2